MGDYMKKDTKISICALILILLIVIMIVTNDNFLKGICLSIFSLVMLIVSRYLDDNGKLGCRWIIFISLMGLYVISNDLGIRSIAMGLNISNTWTMGELNYKIKLNTKNSEISKDLVSK